MEELDKGIMIASGIEPELLMVTQMNIWVGMIDEDRYTEELSLVRL